MSSKTMGSMADQQAVLGVLKGVREAWEANDAEAFVADYLDDASVVQPGVYRKDRDGRWHVAAYHYGAAN